MRHCKVRHIEAFSDTPHRGNPAGVVPDASGLDEAEMLAIAAAVGFNETVFVSPSENADYQFRFFTPGHEMPLCGHATVAAAFFLGRDSGTARTFTIETRAGVLPVRYDPESRMATMRHAEPAFRPFEGSLVELAAALGVAGDAIRTDCPVVYGSTGTWTLLVPVRGEGILADMCAKNDRFPEILREMPRASVHPFAVSEGGTGYDFAARHFSSPYSGTTEDPVTGTASGVMGAYAMEHWHAEAAEKRFVVAQGKSVGRDGRVYVAAVREGGAVGIAISGMAVDVGAMSIAY